jgi:hypothetical protein
MISFAQLAQATMEIPVSDTMKTMLQKDTVRWGPVVKASGATVD